MPGGVDDKMETLDEAFAVHEAMAELSENCQEILDRFFARDESYQTIGSALDIPSGTIASRISRCLSRLRESSRKKSGGSPVELTETRMTAYTTAPRRAHQGPPARAARVGRGAQTPACARAARRHRARAEADLASARIYRELEAPSDSRATSRHDSARRARRR